MGSRVSSSNWVVVQFDETLGVNTGKKFLGFEAPGPPDVVTEPLQGSKFLGQLVLNKDTFELHFGARLCQCHILHLAYYYR
jgi:hypothetical protein